MMKNPNSSKIEAIDHKARTGRQSFACLMLTIILLLSTHVNAVAAEPGWQRVDQALLVQMKLAEGDVLIQLNPRFAPNHVRQFKKLIKSGFYDGLSFYRVIDGFVAQGGDGSDMSGEPNEKPALNAELEIKLDSNLPVTSVQVSDLFAPETGFVDGFGVALDRQTKKLWLTHCPGVVAMARDNDVDSGSTDFYIVIGQAPRYLDRNLSIFGRVILGMNIVQSIKRGQADQNGMINAESDRTRIISMKLFEDMAEHDKPVVEVTDTSHAEFYKLLDNRRNRTHEFFHHRPPSVLDVCQIPLSTRLGSKAASN